jgi:hypothetical protein
VLVKYRPADETKYFMGRLFFNDTKDYICLGQGFEITHVLSFTCPANGRPAGKAKKYR